MSTGRYDFQWQNYNDHLRTMLNSMRKSSCFTDVTLVCDDLRQIQAHKVVLSACSAVFKRMLESTEKNPIIYLKGIKYTELELLLQFMYIGQTQFDKEHMTNFLRVANDLRVEELLMQDGNFELETNENSGLEKSNNFELKNDLSDKNTVDTNNHGGFKFWLNADKSSEVTNKPVLNKLDMGLQKFKCDNCDASFTWERNFKRHQRKYHNNELMEEMKEDGQKRHQETNSSVIKKISANPSKTVAEKATLELNCQKCNYFTTTAEELKSHMQRAHLKMEYPCNQCEFTATSLGVLKDHIIDDHVKNRFKNILGTK